MYEDITLCDGDCYTNDEGNLVVIHRQDWFDTDSPRTWDNYTHFYVWSSEYDSPDKDVLWCGSGMGRRVPTMWEVLEDHIDLERYEREYEAWEPSTEWEHRWMLELEDFGTDNDLIPKLCDWLNEHDCYAMPVTVGGYYESSYTADLRYCEHGRYDGIIFMTEDDRVKCGTPLDRVVELLRGDCKAYEDWTNSNIFGYTLHDKLGEEIDSCWGFIGNDVAGIAYHTNGLHECPFESVRQFVAAHDDDPDVLVRTYNDMKFRLACLAESLHDQLVYMANVKNMPLAFNGDTLVLEA